MHAPEHRVIPLAGAADGKAYSEQVVYSNLIEAEATALAEALATVKTGLTDKDGSTTCEATVEVSTGTGPGVATATTTATDVVPEECKKVCGRCSNRGWSGACRRCTRCKNRHSE